MRAALTTLAAALALLVPAAASGGGTGSGSWHAPIAGVVPHASAPHALGAIGAATPNPTGPLVLQTQPCVISSLCWVMRTNTVYAIYWMPSGSTCDAVTCATYETGINRYFTDVAGASGRTDNVYSVATQYYDATGPISYSSTFGGSYVDTTSTFPNDCSDGVDAVCNSDAAIEAEIEHVLSVKGWQPGLDTMFFVVSPDGVGSCEFTGSASSSNPCTTNAFCAYHSGFITASNDIVIYGNEPFDGTITGCHNSPKGQGFPNGVDVDSEVNTISHEHNEAITDPAGNAWLDAANFETGDICAWTFGAPLGTTAGGQPYNQVIQGDKYSLQEEYSNDGNACLQHYLGKPVNFGSPTISGVAVQRHLLSSTQGAWSQSPTSYTYQWLRCAADGSGCVAIPGASSSTYVVAAADAGHTLRASVSATNAAGTTAAVSNHTNVAIGVPVSTRAPHISGRARVGRRLSGTHGSWTNSPKTYRYQWLRCNGHGGACSRIGGATHSTYRLTKRDAGHRLRLRVIATNLAGSAMAASAVTARVPAKH
jgi:hypothetical protein